MRLGTLKAVEYRLTSAAIRVVSVLTIASCGAAREPATTVTDRAETPPAPLEGVESPDAICVVREAEGPAPSILVSVWPEVAHPPTPRGRREPRVIYLDELDDYGPLHVLAIDAAQVSTDLGQGSDARMDGDTIAFFARTDTDASTVRVHRDGTRERQPGGTARLPGLGGPMPFRLTPFTRDGRFLAAPRGCEEYLAPCAVSLRDSVFSEHPELDALVLDHGLEPHSIFLTENASVIAVCVSYWRGDAQNLLTWNRSTDERFQQAISGRCLAMSSGGDLVLTANDAEADMTIISTTTREAARTELGLRLSGAAFDACSESVVVVGALSTTQRVMRIFLDGRAPTVLAEVEGGPELSRVEVDARGWVLVASEEPGEPAEVLVVSLAGGAVTRWSVPGRVFGAALGP